MLALLHDNEVVGTVLAAIAGRRDRRSGALERTRSVDGAEPLRRHVRPRVPAVAGVLDRLLQGVVGVRGDWAGAVEVALERIPTPRW